MTCKVIVLYQRIMHGGMLVYSAKIGTCLGIRLVSMCSYATIIDVTIPYFRKSLKLCCFLMSRTMVYFHVYIILDFPITHINASVRCQSYCARLH